MRFGEYHMVCSYSFDTFGFLGLSSLEKVGPVRKQMKFQWIEQTHVSLSRSSSFISAINTHKNEAILIQRVLYFLNQVPYQARHRSNSITFLLFRVNFRYGNSSTIDSSQRQADFENASYVSQKSIWCSQRPYCNLRGRDSKEEICRPYIILEESFFCRSAQ